MRLEPLLIVLIALTFSEVHAQNNTQDVALETVCPDEIPLSGLDSEQGLFYTLPSQDGELQLQLWYADSNGTIQIPVNLIVEDLLSISPDGKTIVALRSDTDYVVRNLSYDYYGATFSDIFLIDTETFEMTSLDIPEWVNENRYVKRVHWISDSTFTLTSTTENITVLEVDIADETIDSSQWELPGIDLTYPDGETRLSPDGNYMYYTTQSNTRVGDILWEVIDKDGISLISGTAYEFGSAAWSQDNRIIHTYNNGNILISSLDESVQSYQYNDNGVLRGGGIPDANNQSIAFIGIGGYFDLSDSINNEAVVLFNPDDSIIQVYCGSALRFDLRRWSNDNWFTFIARDTDYTQIILWDVYGNRVINLLPELLATSDGINSIYVRIIGWY